MHIYGTKCVILLQCKDKYVCMILSANSRKKRFRFGIHIMLTFGWSWGYFDMNVYWANGTWASAISLKFQANSHSNFTPLVTSLKCSVSYVPIIDVTLFVVDTIIRKRLCCAWFNANGTGFINWTHLPLILCNMTTGNAHCYSVDNGPKISNSSTTGRTRWTFPGVLTQGAILMN